MNARRLQRLDDHRLRLSDFRSHQIGLAATAALLLAGSLVSPWLIPPAVMCIQAGAVYALRFRRTGCKFMTRRSIWIGATPVDERCRYLLCGWHP